MSGHDEDVDKCKHNKTVYEECLDCHWNAAIEAVESKLKEFGYNEGIPIGLIRSLKK